MKQSTLLSLALTFLCSHALNGFSPPTSSSLKPPQTRKLEEAYRYSDLQASNEDDNEAPEAASRIGNNLPVGTSRRAMLTRSMMTTTTMAAGTSCLLPLTTQQRMSACAMDKAVPFSASWSAIDGLNQMNDPNTDTKFVGFDMNAYKAMRDDATRTPFFEKALLQRLGKNPESQVVLDLGTGPFCLFAIMAADLGAGKVYALEANPAAAESARNMIKKGGYDDVITLVEGFSTQVDLPEKVDFCVAEIIGSIASEEGVYGTIRDAHRFLKNPTDANNWIPSKIQTYGAPVCYTLHNLFGPPEFDWMKLKGEPVRFSCRDNGLQLLSDPQLMEEISFAALTDKGNKIEQQSLTFHISSHRIAANKEPLFQTFRQGSDAKASEDYAQATSHSFSGIAMWPRLFLNDNVVVESRSYPLGGHQKSHWQTVLPIMSGRPIGNLMGGETIQAKYRFELPADVTKPPQYSIEGTLEYNS